MTEKREKGGRVLVTTKANRRRLGKRRNVAGDRIEKVRRAIVALSRRRRDRKRIGLKIEGGGKENVEVSRGTIRRGGEVGRTTIDGRLEIGTTNDGGGRRTKKKRNTDDTEDKNKR